MEDAKIVDLYWKRDERAITESDAKYGVYCYTVANNILSNHEDTKECINDTWVKAWNTIPPQRPKALKPFFAKIIRNLALNRYQMQKAKKRDCDIFLCRYFFLENTAEIAKRYGMRESNVLVILSRLRNKLKKFLRKEGYFV